jgi:hypothetical protein
MEYFSKGQSPRKSRKGSVPVNIETLVKQKRHDKGNAKLSALQFQAFSLVMQEKLARSAAGPSLEPLGGEDPKKPPDLDLRSRLDVGVPRPTTVRAKTSEDVSAEEAMRAVKALRERPGIKKHL